jgi:hypothetical protein
MADTGSNERTRGHTGPQPSVDGGGTAPDYAGLSGDPATGGLPAVLGRLRDAAAAHDDELAGPGDLGPAS